MLADAAAQGIHQIGAGIGGGLLVARLLRPPAQGLVVGEGLPRLEYHAVQGLTGQHQVGVPLLIVSVGGLAEAQHILEAGLQLRHFRGHRLQGDPDGLTGGGIRQERRQRLRVIAQAVGAGDGRLGSLIHPGIHRRDGDRLQNFRRVRRGRLLDHKGIRQINVKFSFGQPREDQLHRR